MTWARAKVEALRLVEEISRERGSPHEIVLTEYLSDASYRSHKPNEAWTREFHTQVTRATFRELLKRGYTCRLVKL